LLEPTANVKVNGIVCCPAPQLKVMMPPAGMAAASADSVQELGVPLPTTVAETTWERRRNTTSVGMRAVTRVKIRASQYVMGNPRRAADHDQLRFQQALTP
jgi:hypothetical protein